MSRECGGCEGKGSHWRWCPKAVGYTAHYLGVLAERAESAGDSIGGNDPAAANACYVTSGTLRGLALTALSEWRQRA